MKEINLIPWDSKILNKKVFEIKYQKGLPLKTLAKLDKSCEKQDAYYVFIKVDNDDIKTIHYLETLGFNYIEFQLRIEKRLVKPYTLPHYKNFYLKEIFKSDVDDIKNICKIAKTTFTTDRFYIDPKINKDFSGKRYMNWILNSLEDNTYKIYKYCFKSNDEIAAFLMVKKDKDKIYIALGGTNPKFKGSGIYLSLLIEYLNLSYLNKNKNIYTTITALNKDVVDFYNLLEFKIIDRKVVLRKVYEHER
ncbi:hypothetical protein CEE44_02210 [Candidatus Woesearchaeota archaeon B3_Woes]|nr:MAG: hypothetical protein CEE44_02210 [Candidatus Woesearchaeota archaeon B3_Woes]